MRNDTQTGIMIGHFEPLHLGHIRSIFHVAGQVQTLHIFITPHPKPNPDYLITLQDKARWLQMACAGLSFINVHILDDIVLPANKPEQFSKVEVDILLSSSKLIDAMLQAGLDVSAPKNSPKSPVLFMAENHPLNREDVRSHVPIKVHSIPTYPAFDTHAIHQNPIKHWDAIHPEARGNYSKTVAIVGGESSGKTTLVHKLANYYGADIVLEMGRHYVDTHLGGSEVALQYSDYAPIALHHAESLKQAIYQAKAPVTIVDTDFVTTQAFCEEYEGRTHPFVTACIEAFPLDYTIMLENNVPWIADGMRSLGSDSARSRFKQRLLEIFARHNIAPHHIRSDDYHQRFLEAIRYIDKVIYRY